jgi:hypothetical protein
MGGNNIDTGADSCRQAVEVESDRMAEATANDAIVTTTNTEAPGPSAKPKVYTIKLFGKLTEAEKWELTPDMISGMMKDVWQDSNKEFDAIKLYKKKIK